MRTLFLAIGMGLLMLWAPAMATEEPTFTQISKQGDIELRDYPALIVAEVTVQGDQKTAVSRGFRILAGYIFGANQGDEKIAMTAPVSQTPRPGVKIAMTAPVSAIGDTDAWRVRFTMPHTFSLESLPKPKDARIVLIKTPPARMAVIRFSGVLGPKLAAEKTAALSAYLATKALHPLGPPVLAQYDPPWTPWFMRRNEIQIPVTVAP